MSVALRKESVDRNWLWQRTLSLLLMSLSARRAWIEIHDGNAWVYGNARSLSARRAWIEIAKTDFVLLVNGVALRKESVDRNDRLRY